MLNWITKNIFSFISDIMSGILDTFGAIISNIFETVADINVNNSLVENATNFTVLFALAFLGIAAAKQIIDVYVLQTAGDAEEEPLMILVRVAQAVAVICSSTWIFNEFLKFSKYFAGDLMSSAHEDPVSTHMLELIATAKATMDMQAIGFILMLAMILIGLIVFCVVAGIRAAELTLMKVLFPIFAVDLLTTNRERWRNFFTSYLVTFCAYSIQLLCFKMCSMTFIQVDYSGGSAIRLITVAGWIILMIRAPRWLEKFAYSSGISNTATSSARMLPFVLLRK